MGRLFYKPVSPYMKALSVALSAGVFLFPAISHAGWDYRHVPTPPDWLMLGWIPALLVVFLFIYWAYRWFRSLPPTETTWLFRASLGATILFIILTRIHNLITCPKTWQVDVCGDLVRDWAGAVTLSGGVTFPIQGPAFHAQNLYMGPYYQMLLGAGAFIWKDPAVFYLIEILTVSAAVIIGAFFVRRAFGNAHALFFLAATLLIGFFNTGYCEIIHDYTPLPIVALLPWISWDMWKTRSGRHFPLLVLTFSLAIQIYGIHAYAFIPIVIVLVIGRIHLKARDIILAAFAFLLCHSFTIFNIMLDGMDLRGFVVNEGEPLSAYLIEVYNQILPLHIGNSIIHCVLAFLIVAFFIRPVFRKPYPGKHLEARIVVTLFFFSAYLLYLSRYNAWQSVWSGVFYPSAPIMLGAVVGEFYRLLPVKRKQAALTSLVVLFFAIQIISASTSLGKSTPSIEAFSLQHTQNMAADLESLSIHSTKDYNNRVHSWFQPSYMLNFKLITHGKQSLSEKDLSSQKDVWLAQTPLPRLEPGTITTPSEFGLAYVSYQSNIDKRKIEVTGSYARAWYGLDLLFIRCSKWPAEVVTGSQIPYWSRNYREVKEAADTLHFKIPIKKQTARPLLVQLRLPLNQIEMMSESSDLQTICKTDPTKDHHVCAILPTDHGYEFKVHLDQHQIRCGCDKLIDFFDPPIISAGEFFSLFKNYENESFLHQSSRDL